MAFNQWCLGDYERVALGLNIPSYVSKTFANGIYSSITERKNTDFKNKRYLWKEKGWHSGESTRLPPMWPGFKSRCRRHMWLEFVVGSLLCSERFFSCTPVFPSHRKPGFSNSNSTRNQVDEEPLGGGATSKSCIQ